MPTRNQQMSRVAPFSQLLMATGDPALTRIGAADIALQGSENRYGRGRGRPMPLGGGGVVYEEGKGFYVPEAYNLSQEAAHRRKMEQLEAMWGQRQANQEQATLRGTAKEQTSLEFMNQTLAELEALKATGGNVGKELGDSIAGLLESAGMEQPAKWVERATYNELEEKLRPKLRLSFMNMFQDLQKGAASDTDLRLMRELDPSVRGLSMAQRINNLTMARNLYQDILDRTISPTAPGEGTSGTSGGGGPVRPEGVTDAEWESWLIEQGML